MISRTGSHAIRAMSALGALADGQYAGAASLAASVRAPGNYLSKLLRQLAKAGLLEARKGSGGGFRLARDPADITLLEILDPVERVTSARACIMGRANCGHREPCGLHEGWARARDAYLSFLRSTTLKDAAASAA